MAASAARFLTEGNYVSGIAGAATLLTTIVSVNPVYVYADIDEDTLLKFNALAQPKKLDTDGDGKVPVELQLGDEAGFPASRLHRIVRQPTRSEHRQHSVARGVSE